LLVVLNVLNVLWQRKISKEESFFHKISMIFDDVERKKNIFKGGGIFQEKGGYFSRNYLPL